MPNNISVKALENLLASYKEKRRLVINPDNITDWNEFGFSEKPEEYDTIEDFMEEDENAEFDERQQISMQLYDEVIEDLENLIENAYKKIKGRPYYG